MSKKKKKKSRIAPPIPAAPKIEVTPPSKQNLQEIAGGTRAVQSKKILLLIAILVLAIGGFAMYKAGVFSKYGFGAFKGDNVLFITIDTLRADHLPAYGYAKIKTPNIDRLANKSFIFQDVFSHVPATLPEHTSMMTGLLPIYHGVRDNAGFFVDPKLTTLAELLKSKGYTTAAFVSSYVLNSRWQLNQGFDSYSDVFAGESPATPNESERRAEETEADVEKWLDSNKDHRFFAWVHFYDPHEPYKPPEPFKSEYTGHPYDGEIAYTDQALGKLLDKLLALNLTAKTLIILTSDHGESLGEHGEITHGVFLYNATLHVPLFISLPGQKKQSVKGIVRHIDLAPTILEWLGFHPNSAMQGKTLIPLIQGKEKERRVVYSESYYSTIHYGWSPLQSITADHYRYIKAPKPELYDLQSDPQEKNNLIHEKMRIAQDLSNRLGNIIQIDSRKDLNGPQKLDAESQAKLQSLGYIGTIAKSTPQSRQADPKDKMYLHRAISQVLTAINDRNYPLVIQAITPILQEDPDMPDAHFFAGIGYSGLNDSEKAIAELQKAISLRPDHLMALYNLGNVYERTGNLAEAVHWYQQLLKYDANNLFANTRLGMIYEAANQAEKAKPYFLKAANLYEKYSNQSTDTRSQATLHATLGEFYFRAGEPARAEQHLEKALQIDPNTPVLHYNLAKIYEAKGDIPRAVDAYKKEIAVAPDNYRALNNLGTLYRQSHQYDEAVSCFQKVIQLVPQDPNGYYQLYQTYQMQGKTQQANQILRILRQKKQPSGR